MSVRPAAVAGLFYPANASAIRSQLSPWLQREPCDHLRAVIVPHAGVTYSGEIASHAYRLVAGNTPKIQRVVLLCPNHRVPLVGIAAPSVNAFETPLGSVPIDGTAVKELTELPYIHYSDSAHREEHAIEVQLPFLQLCLETFQLLPLVVGETSSHQVAELIERLWQEEETLVVISTDLSHFLSYEKAQAKDQHTLQQILLTKGGITGSQACGCNALNGFLEAVKNRAYKGILLAQGNSGDRCTDKERVVGYASLAYFSN